MTITKKVLYLHPFWSVSTRKMRLDTSLKHGNVVDYLKEMPMEYERNCYFTSLKPTTPDSGGQVANNTHAQP